MNCDNELHEGLFELGEKVCPFCNIVMESNEKPQDHEIKYYLCCDCQDIINDNSMLVCRKCGTVQGYAVAKEYIDFYENRHKFKRKSVYHRKYHVDNVIFNIRDKYGIVLTYQERIKMEKIFSEIGKITDQLNGNEKRKRIISINFVICKVLSMLKIPFEDIPISKSKKTLAFYDKYWANIMSLIGDKINDIAK